MRGFLLALLVTPVLICVPLSAEVPIPNPGEFTIQTGGGIDGPSHRIVFAASGAAQFEFQGKRKARTHIFKVQVPQEQVNAVFEKLKSALVSIEDSSVHQAKCFDGTTYQFSIRNGNFQRSWTFFNLRDLKSISPALCDVVDDLSKIAPIAFRIFTTLPEIDTQ